MELDLNGVNPSKTELIQFREFWRLETARENVRLTGDHFLGNISILQSFTIDLFCGVWAPPEKTLGSVLPAHQ